MSVSVTSFKIMTILSVMKKPLALTHFPCRIFVTSYTRLTLSWADKHTSRLTDKRTDRWMLPNILSSCYYVDNEKQVFNSLLLHQIKLFLVLISIIFFAKSFNPKYASFRNVMDACRHIFKIDQIIWHLYIMDGS